MACDNTDSAAPADTSGTTGAHQQRPNLVNLCLLQHTALIAKRLELGCMNVHSVAGKIEDIVAMKRDQSIDMLCLCETWHDEDSVNI